MKHRNPLEPSYYVVMPIYGDLIDDPLTGEQMTVEQWKERYKDDSRFILFSWEELEA